MMYEDFDNEIPDSDAKIYMSLDDIIKMQSGKKHRPGSVKSVASHRSTYSNKSRRSTYSNKSRRSTYSNKSRRSTYSNRSKRSTYSNKSRHSAYSNNSRRSYRSWHPNLPNHHLQKNITGGQLVRRNMMVLRQGNGIQHKVLKRPGVYIPNTQIKLYRNKVRQAIRTLSYPIIKNKYRTGIRKVPFGGQYPYFKPNFSFVGKTGLTKVPSNITVEIENFPSLRRIPIRNNSLVRVPNIRRPPLTRQTLALFDKINKKKSFNNSHMRTAYSNSSQFSFSRHSVQGSLNRRTQKEIRIMQKKFAENYSNIELYEMDFVPTPCTTRVLISDRFSSYD